MLRLLHNVDHLCYNMLSDVSLQYLTLQPQGQDVHNTSAKHEVPVIDLVHFPCADRRISDGSQLVPRSTPLQANSLGLTLLLWLGRIRIGFKVSARVRLALATS